MKLIIANWKMNPETEDKAVALAKSSDVNGLIIAPPFPFIKSVKSVIENATLGAQDLFWEESGPYTGEVSARELKSLGVRYVIIGHSERRALGETDEQIARKIKVAVEAGLTPVLCVGESDKERASGKTEDVIRRKLKVDLSLLSLPIPHSALHMSFVIAYEPLWAIGTGVPNTPQDTVNVVEYIHKVLSDVNCPLSASVLYGGSVDAGNAESFLKEKAIDGALVGGASLKPAEIKKIVEIAFKF